MAKRTCDPTVGSIGRQTYLIGRNGQVVRTRSVPSNPNTQFQSTARANFELASRAWDALTQEQQLAWIVAAANLQSRTRLGMSGALTGNQFFVKVNANLLQNGAAQVTTPPDVPTFTAIPATAFANAEDAMEITTTAAWPATTRVRASAPVNNGVHRAPGLVDIGVAPVAVATKSDIKTLYDARFGPCPAGKKVFIELSQTVDGFDGPPLSFSAVCVEV